MNIHASIETTRTSAAIAIVRITGPDLDSALPALGLAPIAIGQVRLMDILGVDRGIVARFDEHTLDLMIHGGRGVVDLLVERLDARGVGMIASPPLQHAWPEACHDIEARMLDVLSRAQGRRTTDLLLAQPRRWRSSLEPTDHPALRHLLHPPLVAIWGPANIGKSSLVNRLARETVSVVADLPGTTRDAVCALVELDGLVVRLLDAPGATANETDPLVLDACRIARTLVLGADLVLLCGDATAQPVPHHLEEPHSPNFPPLQTLNLALRVDRGRPVWPRDLDVSAHTSEGIQTLARLVREMLVPDTLLADERPWRFWSQSH